jgi:hypothetical protein
MRSKDVDMWETMHLLLVIARGAVIYISEKWTHVYFQMTKEKDQDSSM